ncbi:hypothetical protein T484DRAFT_1783295, partial [Baffinella frigidus]
MGAGRSAVWAGPGAAAGAIDHGSFPAQRKVSSTLESREHALAAVPSARRPDVDSEVELTRDMELLQKLLQAGGGAASEAASVVARKMQRHLATRAALQRKVSSTPGSREDALHHRNLPSGDVVDSEVERLTRDMELLQRLLQTGGEAASEAASVVARTLQGHVSLTQRHVSRMDEGEELDEMEGMLEEAMYLVWVEFAEDDPEERVEYVGQMLSGIRYGLGSMRWKDGTRYDGEWRCDLAEGFGCEYFPNGSSYKGEFKGDERSGLGIFNRADGATFAGSWLFGVQHGDGIVSAMDENRTVGLAAFDQPQIVEQTDACLRDAMHMGEKARQMADEVLKGEDEEVRWRWTVPSNTPEEDEEITLENPAAPTPAAPKPAAPNGDAAAGVLYGCQARQETSGSHGGAGTDAPTPAPPAGGNQLLDSMPQPTVQQADAPAGVAADVPKPAAPDAPQTVAAESASLQLLQPEKAAHEDAPTPTASEANGNVEPKPAGDAPNGTPKMAPPTDGPTPAAPTVDGNAPPLSSTEPAVVA